MPSDKYKSPQDFLQKMYAGELDGHINDELKELSRDQLEVLAQLLVERDSEKRRLPRLQSN